MANAMQELMDMKIWMLWRWEADENGRPTKKPFAAGGGPTGTDDKWSYTWVSYNEAVKAKEHNSVAAGVGFKIPKGYYFIDIDHKALSDPLVQTILARHDSYAEYSVSGKGIHQYGKCDFKQIPTYIDKDGKTKLDRQFYMKNPHNDMELYIGSITNRFAAYTGNIIEDKPLRECTAAVLTTLDKNMRRKEKTKYSAKRDGDRTDFDIVCNLRKQKNGEKFKKLYDEGDFSDYGSQSEADAALCAIIAFRTGPDPDAIDAVFRDSALYRDKWERDDYREATINIGIEACHGVFHRSRMDHPYFIKFDERGAPYVFPPLLAKWTREQLHYILVRDNGRQALLIYVYEDGCYRLYAPDMLKGVMKGYIAGYDEELVSMGKVAEAYNQVITDLNYVSQDDLNANEDLINFNNGLLRITESNVTLVQHSPDILSTIQIPCSWTGRETPTPVFDRYMRTLTNGDKAIEQLLLEFIGVCISNVKGWRMKKALFLVGDGDTGKSQLKSLVERLIGKGNFIGIDLREIESRFGTGAIYNTRLAGSSDMSFLAVVEMKIFKKTIGGDSLFAEFKGQQAFEFTYNGLLWFCMNRLPKFGGDDGKWVYDRIMVVRCPNVIPKDKQDKTLLDKMYAERDGIVHMLSRQEYLGHTVNFKTYRKSYKQKKQMKNDPSEWVIFENTHEAIIEKPVFEVVQKIRDGRRRVTPMGEMPILSGMLFCADCGNKLYQVRHRGWEHDKEHFVCATYRKIKGGCSSHQIRNVVVEELILDGIRRVTAFARDHEDEFVEMVTKKTRIDLDRSMRDGKRELEQSQARISKLDDIIQKLYEDNIEGKISDERFAKMTANYEAEQLTLESRLAELKSTMTSVKESALGVDHFLALVRKYTDTKELTAEIIREFVEKIYVYKAERIDGRRVQRIKIVYNCIGEFDTPVSASTTEQEKSA